MTGFIFTQFLFTFYFLEGNSCDFVNWTLKSLLVLFKGLNLCKNIHENMKLCTVVHRVSLLLVICDQSPTLWGTTFGQFELLSAHRADELAPNRDQVKFSLYLGVIHKLRYYVVVTGNVKNFPFTNVIRR